MKAELLFRNKDYEIKGKHCYNSEMLAADLGLEIILKTMAAGDDTVLDICSDVLPEPLQSLEEIGYRQEILRDALNNPDAVRELYGITCETEKKRRESWYWLSPSNSLSGNFSDLF